MLLADIGNSSIKIYNKGSIKKYDYQEAFKEYKNETLYYISVNKLLNDIPKNWIDISEKIELDTSYVGLGVDRKAVCLAKDDGLIVDAGSAITLDIMQNGVHLGGFILPGLEAFLGAYANISPALNTGFNPSIDLDYLPQKTADAISYGVVKSVTTLIENSARGEIVFTGGDGKYLSRLVQNSIYDETLVFKGMMKGLGC